jgi:FkbM family methyltransferase
LMSVKDLFRAIVPKSLWERLRQFKIARGVEKYYRRVVEHTYAGYHFKLLLADGLGEGWYDKDWDDLEEINLLATGKLSPGATVFDLGAHQGVVAMIMSRIVGPSGRVIAVEGMRHNCDVAEENLRHNTITNVTVHHAVIAEQDGMIRFFEGLNGSVSREGVGQMVEAITIDSLNQKYGPPDVVFIDIEGFEANALKGATKTLQSTADWFVEVHAGCGLEEYGGSAEAILKVFDPERYSISVWNLNTNQLPQTLGFNNEVLKKRFALVAIMKRQKQSMLRDA